MTRQNVPLRGREIIERWCALSERRLEYLTDLFESGRWRRYHSEADFLENIQEAKAATETWRRLATQEAGPDNMPVTWSWLDRPAGAPHRRSGLPEEPRQEISLSGGLKELPKSSAPSHQLQSPPHSAAQPVALRPDDATVVLPEAVPGDFDWQSGLDRRVILERYPILRNAI